MTSRPFSGDPPHESPLTADEQQRIGSLLSSVSTQTLLQSLVSLCGMNDDARLIIGELVARLPPERPSGDVD
ncbi:MULTISPECIES: hypothetical protein [unclassified Sphingomonas]|uniref:hypothetical protein n=1 Tax=Sphingomonas TaxID=13687 RepID=UPI002A69EACB|nr:hypothetical protein [Sphingomonas sp. CFBP8993]MDY0957179.1 hypothetical protein [Sphingomonas sp. CFBP8993]